MKKKLALFMLLALTMSVFVGCGSKDGEEQKAITGIVLEKKDFMFTLLDPEGIYYGFSFETKPENYDELNNGDTVNVTYTGIVSEVDSFKGEIIEIEKVK